MKPKPVAWIRSGDDQLSLVKGKSDGYMIWKPLYSEAFVRQQQAEIEALKSVVYWLKENRPEVWDDIKKWSKL